MESKEVIARIGKILKDNTAITEDEYIAVMNIFCENTFDYDIQQLYNNFEKTKYDYYIPEKILMRCYKNKSYSKALSLLAEDMDSENKTYEWGILFHNKGIWLLNRDIKVSNTQFSSQRTVFKILFTNKTDSKYFLHNCNFYQTFLDDPIKTTILNTEMFISILDITLLLNII